VRRSETENESFGTHEPSSETFTRSEAREGRASEREKPRSARSRATSGEIQRRDANAPQGPTPWSEAASVLRDERAGDRAPHLRKRGARSRGEPITGGESRAERQGRSVASQALKGETPGASLVERHQGVRRRSKASRHMVSAKTQLDPGEANPGEVASVGWVTLKGRQTSGERSHP